MDGGAATLAGPAAAGATAADAHRADARIGPNAILQLVPVLDRACGRATRDRLLAAGGFTSVPDASAMVDECAVADVHQALRAALPGQAAALGWAAGTRTGDYIRINRIPRPAQAVLRALPRTLATRLLARAIAKHAWTFAGSGRFAIVGHRPLTVEIADNPVVRGERAAAPVCHWHAAVFERLFRTLVDPDLRCREVACCAAGAPACRFVIDRP